MPDTSKNKEKSKNTDIRIVIEGITNEGETFRPSDWPERVSGRMASFKNQRMVYSPLLHPGIKSGRKCLIVKGKLKAVNPEMFNHVMEFATLNNLKVIKEEQNLS
jgi:hypothetical protein